MAQRDDDNRCSKCNRPIRRVLVRTTVGEPAAPVMLSDEASICSCTSLANNPPPQSVPSLY
jgi:hypothetical protein